ncbi:tRNA (5-methyl-U54)-methylenetransferase/reductase [Syntrophotalea carbinolica DSM 2380]|uniref:Methylenetetrahydrofolate--tRNA-(uracil-5-)-methyltransferase TrmFO n=1 Tax=Syntrophotalea carbinolica (strain DSM 2380 / NBRC 103641 / GraBd1) TaxID=338963 RepID=TRMFO_SYNC1|nr:methylenetetrahydrofolate--tRNA-(uracil(54)-C(5))-methyltransferase (FADH(2)-oxidizing) TrmFO [Syntrophotalea carbinolica]Q3A7H9.1 RecName: Full=Methylenetetrahydrofolate--tRNA-(uracil-5-)-methyltransferase TrmFO; AltName: Full=Folate-dependent tRNA (uracil-5-)-methyltransferase; AltName: Full=Folate-dependent tRNA(M-5-U54)-methyltransferase [Syntrophotalea carbinolica DSM 2380]ABA87665.1 tRNA (5-methyl-U54)-methylenetransferase/reductase [Syntrophotalea carbinolica DSM 2380]
MNPTHSQQPHLTIIGAGLAGCEAAWQAAALGVQVTLHEMKPTSFSPAHQSADLAELVCSNSLRGAGMNNAVGCLKEELRRCATLFMQAADATAVPAGGALAVDRDAFSRYITEHIEQHPLITLQRNEQCSVPPEGTVIIASGPLTSDALAPHLAQLTGSRHLYFYDAIAPIIEADSIDFSIAWKASRYGRGGDDYINCPMSRDEYMTFVEALKTADKVAGKDFEKVIHFEGCMPIEEMARRGDMTLAFGPMKPVGLPDPRTGKDPFAVVQLRQDNLHATLFNMVGFQTKLTYPEQRRIFRTIPGLQDARFARLGSMHRNTFINAPRCLDQHLRLTSDPRMFFAGQITGVEGYVESAACGFLAGLFAAGQLTDHAVPLPPATTGLGALLGHLSHSSPDDFQPMNVNYGLFPPLEGRKRKRSERRLAMAERALRDLEPWRQRVLSHIPDLKPFPAEDSDDV